MSKRPSAEQLEANKEVVKTLMKRLFDPATGNTEETRRLMTPEYIQHNPNFADGPDAIMGFLETEKARQIFETVKFAGEPVLIAEGDYVVMMQPVYRPIPDRPGETFISYWFDMWRMENGRAAEHWDYADWDPEMAGKLPGR
jgi:predicted SnoaL-like aldol condensation-catalyzing enzyme